VAAEVEEEQTVLPAAVQAILLAGAYTRSVSCST
jgi:hypothetical protein